MSQTDGLKDTIACDTRISQIVDDSLSYAGYNISELVEHHASFEEVIYLLWHLHLPTQIELKHLRKICELIMPLAMRWSSASLSSPASTFIP